MGRLRVALAVGVLVAAVPAFAQTPDLRQRRGADLLFAKCVECHRPTMFAPMSLMKFDEARPWAKSIRNRVADAHHAALGRRPVARRRSRTIRG